MRNHYLSLLFSLALMATSNCSYALTSLGGEETLTGVDAADILNTAYNDDKECNPVVGVIYCKGVTVRSVDNGNFPPWASSPAARSLKSISFTWLHHKLSTNTLYHRAGFVAFTTPVVRLFTASGQHMLGMPRCIYPFDAYTTRTRRGSFGCDFESTGSAAPEKSSCSDIGVTTASAWSADYRRKGQINYKQCSISARGTTDEIITVHESFPELKGGWNEVLIETLPDESMRLTIAAFIYDPARGDALGDARTFQKKLAQTNRRVPIIKLDFKAAPQNRFTYSETDQVAFP